MSDDFDRLDPREHELPNGDLTVSGMSPFFSSTVSNSVVVPEAKRPFYELLFEILETVHVRDCFPANLAVATDDLPEAQRLCRDIDRGSVIINNRAYGMSYSLRAAEAIDEYRDRDPVRLVAVGCSGSKHDGDGRAIPAKYRYKGGYWTNKRDYAETIGDEWSVISAEFGLLRPDDRIPYYKRVPKHLRGIPVDADQRLPNGERVDTMLDHWALRVYEGLAQWLRAAVDAIDPRDIELEILLGRKYADPLKDRGVFERLAAPADLEVSFPFRSEVDYSNGGGIGNQRSWMVGRVEAASHPLATDGGDST